MQKIYIILMLISSDTSFNFQGFMMFLKMPTNMFTCIDKYSGKASNRTSSE